MKPSYWQTQAAGAQLFPDIEWNKPEQRALAGKLLLIGGNKLGFAAVAAAYETAQKAGVGDCKAVLPDILKKSLDPSFDCVYLPTNPSGGFSKDAVQDLRAYVNWSAGMLLIGDAGRNAETAMLYEHLTASDRWVVITRDALDLVRSQANQWLDNPSVCAVATFAQLQKIFQEVHYPKMLLFRMQLAQLVEVLHKFTITYPAKIATLHQGHLIVASDGQVSTTPCDDALVIWRGTVATKIAVNLIQHPQAPFEAMTAAVATK